MAVLSRAWLLCPIPRSVCVVAAAVVAAVVVAVVVAAVLIPAQLLPRHLSLFLTRAQAVLFSFCMILMCRL